jgi:hypothetical protein
MKDAYGIPDDLPQACHGIRPPIAGVPALAAAHLCPPIHSHRVLALTTRGTDCIVAVTVRRHDACGDASTSHSFG